MQVVGQSVDRLLNLILDHYVSQLLILIQFPNIPKCFSPTFVLTFCHSFFFFLDATAASGYGTVFGRFSAGVEFSCALDTAGKGYCFGNNFDGQLGTGNLKRYSSPEPVLGDYTWAQISAGDWHSCGMTVDQDAYCWGYNADGRCGLGNTKSPILKPELVKGNYKWKFISAGYFYSCGVRRDGALFCWGKNNYGRLGNGKVGGNYTTPQRVGKDVDWVNVLAGGDHTCALKADKSVWCFGNNEEGQLGVGKTPKELPISAVPVKVQGTYKYLSNSSKFACAIKTDGTGVCWGSNAWGNLGIGKNGSYAIKPTKIKSSGLWRQLSCGQFVGCGIKSDNTGWCWGAGYLTPLKFKPDGWITMTAGDWNGSGVNANGTAYSWWENEWGEGGVGYTGYLKKPTEVVGGTKWAPPSSTAGK